KLTNNNHSVVSVYSDTSSVAKTDLAHSRLIITILALSYNLIITVKSAAGWCDTRPSPSPKAATTGDKPILGQGFAAMLRSNAYWACAVQVSVVPKTGKVRVLNVVSAVEPGIVINPLQMKRIAEGGVIMGVSETLHEQVKFN